MANYNRQQETNIFEQLSGAFRVMSELSESPHNSRARDVSRSMSFFAESNETNSTVMANTFAICGGVLLGGVILSALSTLEEDNNESPQNH